MKTKKNLTKLLLMGMCLLIPAMVNAASLNEEEILKRLEALQKQVMEQQEIINELMEAKVAGEPTVAKETVAAAAKEEAKGADEKKTGLQLSKHIDRLKLKGDLRLRYERRDRDNPAGEDDDARDRMRHRFRLGLLWDNTAENWEIAAGLATGNLKATTTTFTWSEDTYFETGDIRLDYAYAKHTLGDFKLIGGQQINPFKTAWLLWDSDVRPAGFTANYDIGYLFATVGGYDVIQNGDDFGIMYAGQVGSKMKAGKMDFLAAVGYYHFADFFAEGERPNPDYDYSIGDVYGEMKLPLGITKIKLYGHVFKNFGAEGGPGEGVFIGNTDIAPEDEDMGWVIGAKSSLGPFALEYAYGQVEADSCVPGLKNGCFGDGLGLIPTDVKGHRLKASYNITKHCSFDITGWFTEAIERNNTPEVDIYQVDLNYKF